MGKYNTIQIAYLHDVEKELTKAINKVRTECFNIIYHIILCEGGEVSLMDGDEMPSELTTAFCDKNGEYYTANINHLSCDITKSHPTMLDVICKDNVLCEDGKEYLQYIDIEIIQQMVDTLAYLYPQYFEID